MQLGDRLILNENLMNMTQSTVNSQSGMLGDNMRWPEANEQSSIYEHGFNGQGLKKKEEHRPIAVNVQGSKSPRLSLEESIKAAQEQQEMMNKREKTLNKNLRCEEMMPTLDYFMHANYPYANYNLQSRRDSPPDIMAAERCKQAFTRGNRAFLPDTARNLPSDLSKFTPEQVEAIYKSQGMGIPLSVNPTEFADRTGLITAANRTGIPSQRPSPQTDLQHHNEFNKGIFMGMDDKLLRIAEAENQQKSRNDINPGNSGMFPGVIRMPQSSQMQGHQGMNIHPQNMRFNPEMMHQGAHAFAMDPRFYEQQRTFPMTNSRADHLNPGEMSSQRLSARNMENSMQKKSLHVPSRPMALGPNFIPQAHLPVNVAQSTPSSEEINSASPAGSSPYPDFGTPSPKSDENPRTGTKQKAKNKHESHNQCAQCGKSFSSSSALAKHKLIHSDERRYVCQICSKGFKRQDHLNGHMVTHRDKKPYECSYSDCDKSYSDMRSLKRHLENHHGVGAASTSQASASSSSQTSSTTISTNQLLCPAEDRNNNMKGVVAPGRPSSAPSANSEARPRSRIRSNSCEDLPNKNNDQSDNETCVDDLKDDIFEENEPKKTESLLNASDQSEQNRRLSDASVASNISNKNQDVSLSSPHRSFLQQWPNTGPYPPGSVPNQSWNNLHNQWNNAQFLTNLALAQSQNNLPFFLGYRQQFQQFHPPGSFPNGPNDASCHMEPSGKKAKLDDICSSQNAFQQNALQMFASMAAQRAPMPTDMLLQQRGIPFFGGVGGSAPVSMSKATNAAAIAIAAAKDGSMFCIPNDARMYVAHPGAAQWQDVIKDDAMLSQLDYMQKNAIPEDVSDLRRSPDPSMASPRREESQRGYSMDRNDFPSESRGQLAPQQSTELNVLVDRNASTPQRESPSVSPKRKQKPHPGPIIIPASVNNKVTHSVTFTGSTTRSLSPVKREFHNAPIYTPPPMLSPRSIFFTGATCGTPRSALPLTPGRLLLSARRLSTTDGGKDEETEPVIAYPEPVINVGPQFQAEVKRKTEPRENAQNDEHRATLMWAPLKEDKNKINEVENFLDMSCSLALFGGASNKEYASHILHRTRGSVKEAVRLLLSRRHILRADDPNADYHYAGSTRWTAKERLAFREAYRTKGKDFNLIQKEVNTKTVKQCVEFYYLWKATNPEGFRARTRYVEVESEQVNDQKKTTSSTEGMKRSTATSEFLQYRAENIVAKRLCEMEKAIIEKDFNKFAALTMQDSNQLHAICLDTYPPITPPYLNETSHRIIKLVTLFNEISGKLKAAYTFDAGPNAFVFTTTEFLEEVLELFVEYFGDGSSNETNSFIRGIPSKLPNRETDLQKETKLVGTGPEELHMSESLIDEHGKPKSDVLETVS